ncbi:hypothetical protein CA54_60460 [Symmachiella macrocystis]|uniref:Double zinc ribbon n=1 Tax=Symmachiella macrocystis TaxID=2527985 RepID=A0A5C6B175_9PLAN|nr:hypothetical protein [Symmachiella macrocystis]TWU04164.1 hypothetical protein CA54_60460 [Symmachiella macrocystis]
MIEFECPTCGKALKVRESSAGKTGKCPDCNGKIQVPDAVYDAEEVESYSTQGDDDFSSFDGYENAGTPIPREEAEGAFRHPCPVCGEMIKDSAVKCRYCGEIFDETLKKKESRHSDEDADLTTGDWVFCIICSGIACIFGIVYMIQGKPKGIKMVGISFVMQIVWGIVRVILEAAANR